MFHVIKAWKVLYVGLKICVQIQYILFLNVFIPVRYLFEDLEKEASVVAGAWAFGVSIWGSDLGFGV